MKISSIAINLDKFLHSYYWLSPIIIFIFQLIYTLNSSTQFRYEELAESVRNVYWLSQGLVYDGVSSNVGWYATLLAFYNIFGFTLDSAKYYRLILQLISLICLALFFKKYLNLKQAWIAIITIGLSPTFLFFNTLQTSYGIDVQYLSICLYLISVVNFKKIFFSYILTIIIFILLMIIWMSYPTFIYYLPLLIIFYLYQLFQNLQGHKYSYFKVFSYLNLAIVAFISPLIIAFIYIKNSYLLIYDSIQKSGIFRGAGTFYFQFESFSKNTSGLINDLFGSSYSYHFEINQTEFSALITIPALILVLVSSLIILSNKKYRLLTCLVWSVFMFSLIFTSFTFDPSGRPGMRRYTPVLAAFYTLYVIIIMQNLNKKLMFLLLLIPLHHLLVYPINFSHLQNSSPNRYSYFFEEYGNPTITVDKFVRDVQVKDLALECPKTYRQYNICRYSEIYTAIAGSCLWNKLNCHQIYGYDLKSQKNIPLSTDLWQSYYFEH